MIITCKKYKTLTIQFSFSIYKVKTLYEEMRDISAHICYMYTYTRSIFISWHSVCLIASQNAHRIR